MTRLLSHGRCAVLSCCLACAGESSPSGGVGGTKGAGEPAGATGGIQDVADPEDPSEAEPAPAQAVFWFDLQSAPGASCAATKSYREPDDALATITGGTAIGDRVVDGSNARIECTVRPVSDGAQDWEVSLRFQGGEIGTFVATGRLLDPVSSPQPGTVGVQLLTEQLLLTQPMCTANVRTLVPGAIWIHDLQCDELRDPSSPGSSCDGRGGVIFENCLH